MKFRNVITAAVVAFSMQIGLAQEQSPLENYNMAFADLKDQQAELLLLGTFHFKDAGLDGYKPQHDVNIMSPEKQEELEEVLQALKAYGPNKIALEVKKERQPKLDSLYQAYLDGSFELNSNEIYQVGFRLAKMLGHKKVYAVDAAGRDFKEEGGKQFYEDKQAYYLGKASAEQLAYEQQLDSAFFRMYRADDVLKTEVTLKDFFNYINHPERLRVGHGHYVNGEFKMGEGTDYFGADASIWWYTRNMRIFHNLLQIKEPGDKVMLLMGAGHIPIIQFQAEASFDYEVVPVSEVLK